MFQDGQSYRTRVLSIRSTNERSVYSTRKSINTAPVESLKMRNSCICARGHSHSEKDMLNETKKEFEICKNGNRNMLQEPSRRSRRFNDNDLPIGDERVGELYIFPNSSIVEFTDVLRDNKV